MPRFVTIYHDLPKFSKITVKICNIFAPEFAMIWQDFLSFANFDKICKNLCLDVSGPVVTNYLPELLANDPPHGPNSQTIIHKRSYTNLAKISKLLGLNILLFKTFNIISNMYRMLLNNQWVIIKLIWLF